jgi:chemotaxis response regulator CheB
MAFVVVQHLDPTRKGFLVDLLNRVTSMQVFQVKESISVQPDCVYIIPPNKDLQLFHGALHLFDPVAPAVCACLLISCFALWPMTGRNKPL